MTLTTPQDEIHDVIEMAWSNYDPTQPITQIEDLSPGVSTNHVYRLTLTDHTIIAKYSRFGHYEHFEEDHLIINRLADILPEPYTEFLARCFTRGGQPYIFKSNYGNSTSWVVFYQSIDIRDRLPARLDQDMARTMGIELARFHAACTDVADRLPQSSKTTRSDIIELRSILQDHARDDMRVRLQQQCDIYLSFNESIPNDLFPSIPIFVDWNIGNFSVTDDYRFYSRWDYDWFRMSTRMLDFYFFSRVVSARGDRSIFTYNIDVMQEEGFVHFLQGYHKTFPLHRFEIEMLPQLYRFFLLNYVIKFGRYFFKNRYATQLTDDTIHTHFKSIDNFDCNPLINALAL